MIRIVNVVIPNKNLNVALRSIYGIGNSSALKILKSVNIDPFLKANDLSDSQVLKISDELKKYLIESDLRRFLKSSINSHSVLSALPSPSFWPSSFSAFLFHVVLLFSDLPSISLGSKVDPTVYSVHEYVSIKCKSWFSKRHAFSASNRRARRLLSERERDS